MAISPHLQKLTLSMSSQSPAWRALTKRLFTHSNVPPHFFLWDSKFPLSLESSFLISAILSSSVTKKIEKIKPAFIKVAIKTSNEICSEGLFNKIGQILSYKLKKLERQDWLVYNNFRCWYQIKRRIVDVYTSATKHWGNKNQFHGVHPKHKLCYIPEPAGSCSIVCTRVRRCLTWPLISSCSAVLEDCRPETFLNGTSFL